MGINRPKNCLLLDCNATVFQIMPNLFISFYLGKEAEKEIHNSSITAFQLVGLPLIEANSE